MSKVFLLCLFRVRKELMTVSDFEMLHKHPIIKRWISLFEQYAQHA